MATGMRGQWRCTAGLALVNGRPGGVRCPSTIAASAVRPPSQPVDPSSDLERRAAAAALDDVGVVEDESPLLQAVVEVHDRTVQVGVELLVHGQLDAVHVDHPVPFAGTGVEVQAIGKAAAAAPLHAYAKHRCFGEVLLGHDLLDLTSGLFGQGHTHRIVSLSRFNHQTPSKLGNTLSPYRIIVGSQMRPSAGSNALERS